MATNADVEMADASVQNDRPDNYADLLQTSHTDAFAFSESEQRVLQLYDQLRDLELQQSLLQAHLSGTSASNVVYQLGSDMVVQHTCRILRRSQMMHYKNS